MTTLTIGAISVTDTGSGTYEITDWDPGQTARENSYAESEHQNGAILTNSRKVLGAIRLTVRVTGADADAALTSAAALVAELDNDGAAFTISELVDSTTTVYDCLPATTSVGRDPLLLEEGMVLVTASIPRQP